MINFRGDDASQNLQHKAITYMMNQQNIQSQVGSSEDTDRMYAHHTLETLKNIRFSLKI